MKKIGSLDSGSIHFCKQCGFGVASCEHDHKKPIAKKHFIAMAGMCGCLPNYCDVFTSAISAARSLAFLHERSESWAKKLSSARYKNLNLQKDGNEYCEISECNCDEPWIHQDGQTKEGWLKENAEDFGLTDETDETDEPVVKKKKIKRIIRNRHLTAKEANKYKLLREKIETEFGANS